MPHLQNKHTRPQVYYNLQENKTPTQWQLTTLQLSMSYYAHIWNRGHRCKARGKGLIGNWGGTFSRRVMGIWNELPEVPVEAGTITKFEKHLFQVHGKERFRGI